MKQCYTPKNFRADALSMISQLDSIIREYQAQGYVLTVRQLYYQLVARDIIANTLQEYKRVAGLINDAKLAGYLDWDALEDRTREFVRRSKWESGREVIDIVADQFHKDLWEGQSKRVFVIVEKEALVGVLERTCNRYDVPLLAARGYPSGSVIREFVERDILPATDEGQEIVILHLGDHDPSGIDMTRDLTDRIDLFAGFSVELVRIALTMDQIDAERPPENPAKTTDSRFNGYMRLYGTSSWELDALSPAYLDNLVSEHIDEHIDRAPWDDRLEEIDTVKGNLRDAAVWFSETFE